jgi:hypothetical protein
MIQRTVISALLALLTLPGQYEPGMDDEVHRVADQRMLRLIQKWLKAGVSEDGQWSETRVVRRREQCLTAARRCVPALRLRSVG